MQLKKSAANFYALDHLVENLEGKCLSWGRESWCEAVTSLSVIPGKMKLLLQLLWDPGD